MNLSKVAASFFSVLGVVGLAACASYTPSSPQAAAVAPKGWQVVKGIAIAADPYLEKERQKAFFDAALTEANVLAIQIAVENRTDQGKIVRPSEIQLVLTDGRAIYPTSVESTVARVGESGSVIGAALAFGLVGAIVASNAENDSRAARTSDYSQKAYNGEFLAKGERREGVIFFSPYRSICEISDAMLRV